MNKIKSLTIFKRASSSTVSAFLAYMILFLILSVASPFYLSVTNLLNVVQNASVMGIMACGLTFCLITGGLDLSNSAVVAVSGITAVRAVEGGVPIMVAILMGVIIGALCGSVNGFMITVLRINPFITSLATMNIFRGAAYVVSNGESITLTHRGFKRLGIGKLFGIVPYSAIIFMCCIVIVWFILTQTGYGRKIFAIGANSSSAYLSGINVNKDRFILFVVNGIFNGIAGIVFAAQVGAAIPSAATGIEIQVVASVILGGVSLSGGRGSIIGTFFGVMILATVSNGMTLLGIPSFYQMIIKGIVLALAVIVDVVRGGGFKTE